MEECMLTIIHIKKRIIDRRRDSFILFYFFRFRFPSLFLDLLLLYLQILFSLFCFLSFVKNWVTAPSQERTSVVSRGSPIWLLWSFSRNNNSSFIIFLTFMPSSLPPSLPELKMHEFKILTQRIYSFICCHCFKILSIAMFRRPSSRTNLKNALSRDFCENCECECSGLHVLLSFCSFCLYHFF